MYETNHPDHRDNQRKWNTDGIEYRRKPNSIIVFDANNFKEHGRIWTYKVAERKRREENEGRPFLSERDNAVASRYRYVKRSQAIVTTLNFQSCVRLARSALSIDKTSMQDECRGES